MAALLKQFDAFKARIKSDDFECDPDTKEALRLLGLLRCVGASVMHVAFQPRRRRRPCRACSQPSGAQAI